MSKSFDEFYRAFEDRFRGSPEFIKERLSVYRPLLMQLPKKTRRKGIAIDLGCGRGEWLEVVAESGFKPAGVDLNAGMAQVALDKGIAVEIGDAIEYLQKQKSESAAIISAFHLVEHVTTEYLINLLRECHRVLAYGGLLILETPNPENMSVGTWTFYIDPTHEKPIPPVLLEFLVQQSGFERTGILRINGSPGDVAAGALEQTFHTLLELSRDYACLAHKQLGGEETPDILTPYIDSNSQGNPAATEQLKNMVKTVDAVIAEIRTERASNYSAELERNAQEIAVRDAEIRYLHNQIADIKTSHAAELVALLDQLSFEKKQLTAVRSSTSWRLTAPLRGAKTAAFAIAHWPMAITRLAVEQALLWLRHRPPATAGPAALRENDWALEPEQELLDEWCRLLGAPRAV